MVLGTRASGRMTRHMAGGGLTMRTATSTMASGGMTRPMGQASTTMWMARGTMASGRTTSKRGTAWSSGRTARGSPGSTAPAGNTAAENFLGPTVPPTTARLRTTTSAAQDATHGLMDGTSMANGSQ